MPNMPNIANMLKKNDIVEIVIEDINTDAFGIGRHDNIAIFVPSAAVGDRMRVRIVKVLKSYCYGIMEEMLSPSPDRIESDCPVFEQCGGCSLRHITYERECEIKNNWVQQNLRRIAGLDVTLGPIIPSPVTLGYRNKAQYPIQQQGDELAIGFYAKRSHRVVRHTSCLIEPELFTEIVAAVEKFILKYSITVYDEQTHRGLLRHIYLRRAEVTEQYMLCLVINGTSLPHSGQFVRYIHTAFPQVSSIVLNVNRNRGNVILGPDNILLFGEGHITDTLCGIEVGISPLTFYQVNRAGAERLYAVAHEFAQLTEEDTLLDLYCGAGIIGLSAAGKVKELIGVDNVPAAIDNAKLNAKKNGIDNAKFITGTAAEAAIQLAAEGVQVDVVIVDPPRKGCEPEVLSVVAAQLRPSRFVYISCNSATMARDIKLLTEQGYSFVKAQALDMFPRTGHVEAVALLERSDATV